MFSKKKCQKKNINVLSRVSRIILILALLCATVTCVEAANNKVFTKNMFDNQVKLTLGPVQSGPSGEGLRDFDRAGVALGATAYALRIEFVDLAFKKKVRGDSVLYQILIDGGAELGKNVPYCPGFSKDRLRERFLQEPKDGSGKRTVEYTCYDAKD